MQIPSMSYKRVAVMIFVACFALWPLVHHLLVARFDLTPWKYFGWSMYLKREHIIRLRGAGSPDRALNSVEKNAVRKALAGFVYYRRVHGELFNMERRAAQVFRAVPDIRRFAVDFSILRLSTRTDRWKLGQYRYKCLRAGESARCIQVERRPGYRR